VPESQKSIIILRTSHLLTYEPSYAPHCESLPTNGP